MHFAAQTTLYVTGQKTLAKRPARRCDDAFFILNHHGPVGACALDTDRRIVFKNAVPSNDIDLVDAVFALLAPKDTRLICAPVRSSSIAA